MHDADALEEINREQLATVTDRLLLRGGQVSGDSFPPNAHGGIATRAAAGSEEHARRASRSRGAGASRPAHVRSATARGVAGAESARPDVPRQRRQRATTRSVRTPVNRPLFAIGIAIPVLVGVGLAVAALR